ncbi:MAG TPA: ATP-binding protein [Chloroflexota bacterium]|nr:ATP-binding protein [Chloroflexota bacterium]
MVTTSDGNQINWAEANQRHLLEALTEVRTALERHIARVGGADAAANALPPAEDRRDDDAVGAMSPPALERLRAIFRLSTFERAILLLCAGIELDASFAGLCAAAQGDPTRTYPTFSLALAAFDEPYWPAITPDAALRRWRLIDVVTAPATPLTVSPLHIDERILHYLTGIQYLDERLAGLVEPVPVENDLAPSHQTLAERIAAALAAADQRPPLIQVSGIDEASRRAVVAAGCAAAGLHLCALAGDAIPANGAEMEGLARMWEREAVLTSSALYVEADVADPSDGRSTVTITKLLERVNSPIVLGTRDRWRPLRRATAMFDLNPPSAAEQRAAWQGQLARAGVGVNGHIDDLVSQFNLGLPAIRASVREALDSHIEGGDLVERLWNAARSQARPRLEDLAQRLVPLATWDDLVLPDAERRLLEDVAAQVQHRATVYETWGFGAVSNRGLGISSLFAGASGTGKTMAAEVLANALHLDLYRIDLSNVVSKYIGETEKNLRRVFDAAEDGGAILFFDEADALFGKRSEVKDSHDRYANVEINYLLQRMESYRGLAVLATNMKGALDPAFMRRIRFVVNFPFPDAIQRAEIWRRIYPSGTPTKDLNIDKLARLNVTGGNIRNIALNAAFLAATAKEPVGMIHLLRAARAECAKIEKPLSEAEIGGWA